MGLMGSTPDGARVDPRDRDEPVQGAEGLGGDVDTGAFGIADVAASVFHHGSFPSSMIAEHTGAVSSSTSLQSASSTVHSGMMFGAPGACVWMCEPRLTRR